MSSFQTQLEKWAKAPRKEYQIMPWDAPAAGGELRGEFDITVVYKNGIAILVIKHKDLP